MSRPRRRPTLAGISLFEALVSVLMIGVCLGVVSSLFNGAARGMRFQEQGDEALRAVKSAVHTLAREVEQAVSVESEAAGGTSLRVMRLQADSAGGALPVPLPTPGVGESPLPMPSPRLAQVRFTFDAASGVLWREVQGRRLQVAERLEDFRVEVSTLPAGDDSFVDTYVLIRAAASSSSIPIRASHVVRVGLRPLAGAREGP